MVVGKLDLGTEEFVLGDTPLVEIPPGHIKVGHKAPIIGAGQIVDQFRQFELPERLGNRGRHIALNLAELVAGQFEILLGEVMALVGQPPGAIGEKRNPGNGIGGREPRERAEYRLSAGLAAATVGGKVVILSSTIDQDRDRCLEGHRGEKAGIAASAAASLILTSCLAIK